MMKELAADPNAGPGKPLGILQTTWVSFPEFVRACNGKSTDKSAIATAACFKALFAGLRGEK